MCLFFLYILNCFSFFFVLLKLQGRILFLFILFYFIFFILFLFIVKITVSYYDFI